jgi:dipeptidyl aminopeptidase/acylaminoacyl peptidase
VLGGALIALAALVSTAGADRAGLAFTRANTVWVARADGSHSRRVVRGATDGRLSPDGRRLAYFRVERGDRIVLYVVGVAGGRARRIGESGGLAWSPDGSRLVTDSRTALYLVDPATGARRDLDRGDIAWPRFAPDGRSLVYGRANRKVGRAYRSDIYVLRLSDGRITRLTRDGHSDRPVWGGRWIVYRHFWFAGDWSMGRLRLMRPDGSASRPFARGDERTSKARMGLDTVELSRDGTHLLACAAAEFLCPPVTFEVPSGRRHRLTVPSGRGLVAYAADLSRDGREVLVDVGPFDGDAHHRVYSIPFAGGTPRLLVREAHSPSWAR